MEFTSPPQATDPRPVFDLEAAHQAVSNAHSLKSLKPHSAVHATRLFHSDDLQTVGHTFTRLAGTAQFLPRLFEPADHEFEFHISCFEPLANPCIDALLKCLMRPVSDHSFQYATILGYADEILLAELTARIGSFLQILQTHLASQVIHASHSLHDYGSQSETIQPALICLHFNNLRFHRKRHLIPGHEPGKHPLHWFDP